MGDQQNTTPSTRYVRTVKLEDTVLCVLNEPFAVAVLAA